MQTLNTTPNAQYPTPRSRRAYGLAELDQVLSLAVDTPPSYRCRSHGPDNYRHRRQYGPRFRCRQALRKNEPRQAHPRMPEPREGMGSCSELKEQTGFYRVELRILDLYQFSSVSKFVGALEKEARVDVLLANAGVYLLDPEITEDGWEASYQVNHLATALLTLLLVPLMRRTALQYHTSSRVTFVNTRFHFFATLDPAFFDAPEGVIRGLSDQRGETSTGFDRYCTSKLFNLFFMRELNRRLGTEAPLVVNATYPSYCRSELGRNWKYPVTLFHAVGSRVLARSEEQGAVVNVWASLAGTAGQVNDDLRDRLRGAYITDLDVAEPSDYVMSAEGKRAQEKIWEETIEILKAVDTQVGAVVGDLGALRL